MTDSGRATRTVTVGTAATLVVPFAPSRLSIVIMNHSANNLWLSTDPGVAADNGILLRSTDPPLVLGRYLHRALLDGPIYGLKETAAGNVTFLEAFGR